MHKSDYLVTPGKKFRLKDVAPDDTGKFKDRDDAEAEVEKLRQRLEVLQQALYAEAKHSLLIVIQAIDTGGKDGTIRSVFSGVNPQGCTITSFKKPSELEMAHDFLWRIHATVPPRSMIGVFNRSHYESVLVERVRNLVPKKIWSKRYGYINDFEEMLAEDQGVKIVKFFLHISKDEQKQRLEKRLADPEKNWKFNPADLDERKLWDDYQEAFDDMLEKCSTEHAPWYVVPADKKWFRNWVVMDTIVDALESLDSKYPAAPEGLDKIVVD